MFRHTSGAVFSHNCSIGHCYATKPVPMFHLACMLLHTQQ